MTSSSIEPRKVIRYIIVAIALTAIAAIFWKIREAIIVAFGAIVFATVLRALGGVVHRLTHWKEKTSVGVAIVTLLISLALLGWLFGAQAAAQFAELHERLPRAVEKLRDWVAGSPAGKTILEGLKAMGTGDAGSAGSGALKGLASALMSGLGHLLVIVFAGVYFALDPKLYREGFLRLLPPARRPQVRRALNDAGVALHKWLVAQLIVMASVGVLSGIGLTLIGVPLALSLALVVGILEFVPVVGPIAAAVPGVLLAFAQGPQTALYAVLIYTAVQQVESYVLTPLVQRWAVALPPVVALLSIVACGLIFGPLGVIFATPLAVVVMALVQHLYVEETLENGRKPASG